MLRLAMLRAANRGNQMKHAPVLRAIIHELLIAIMAISLYVEASSDVVAKAL